MLAAALLSGCALPGPVAGSDGSVSRHPAPGRAIDTTAVIVASANPGVSPIQATGSAVIAQASSKAGAPPPVSADFGAFRPPADVARIAHWAVATGDHGRQPFAIIDKRRARVLVFDADGRLQGSAPALLGLARGDESAPDIGTRPMSQIKPAERTTPAGRFVAEPGVNTQGEDIVWVDYDAAVSMHRVRPNNPKERRLQRLASRTAADNRISYGCVNLPARFYESVVSPAFQQGGIVYVLPDRKPFAEVFAEAARHRPPASQRATGPAMERSAKLATQGPRIRSAEPAERSNALALGQPGSSAAR